MGNVLVIFICLVLPVFGIVKLSKVEKRAVKMAMCGALTFYVSQNLLRIPLLQALMGNVDVQVFFYTNTFISLLFYSFSAGVFEEIGRFVTFKIVKAITLKEAIAFGLGHGGIEAVLFIVIPSLSQSIDLTNAIFASGERLAAITVHIALSVLILSGINKKQGMLYSALAIMLHGIFNLIPSFFLTYFQIPFLAPIIIYVLAIVIIVLVFKYLIKGDNHYEKNS